MHSNALQRFRQALSDTSLFERHFAEGAVRLALGDAEGAEADFASAVEGAGAADRPFFLKAWHGRAQALVSLNRAEEAVPIFAALMEARPDLLDPMLQLGLALLAAGRPAQALAIHERALADHSGHGEIGAILADGAVALDRLGHWAEGRRWCERGLSMLAAPPIQLHLNLAAFHFRLGDRDAARLALLAAVQADAGQAHAARSHWAEWGDGSAL